VIVRSKANSAQATRRTSILWDKSYDELDTQPGSAKQSQFTPGAGKTSANARGLDTATRRTIAAALRKTKPISAIPRGTGIPLVARKHGQDAHATIPSFQYSSSMPIVQNEPNLGQPRDVRGPTVQNSCI